MPQLSITAQPYEATFSRNPVTFQFKVLPYTDEEAQLNTQIICTLFAESSHYKGDFQELKTVKLYPDATGFAEIDFSVLLDSQISFYVPKITSTGLQQAACQAARYYVRYSLINDYEQVQAPTLSDTLHILKGGLAYEQASAKDFFEQKIFQDSEPLRFGYEGEKIAVDEPLWIYFLYPFTDALDIPFDIALNLEMEAGLAGVSQAISIHKDAQQWQIFCVAAGATQQGLMSQIMNGATARSLTFYASADGNELCRLLTFDLYYRNHYDSRTLVYHNSLGGFDTQVFRGEIDVSGTYDGQQVTLLDTGAFAQGRVLKPVDRMVDPRERAGLTGDTGWIPRERIERLRDLLNAGARWELIGNTLKPVLMAAKEVKLYANRDKLFSLGASWQDAFTDANFTPDLYLAEGACPEVRYFNVGQEVASMARVNWVIPAGYDKIEIAYFNSPSLNTALAMSCFVYAEGETGFLDLTLPFNLNTVSMMATIYWWARVICDDSDPLNIIAGPWTSGAAAGLSAVLRKYIAPAVRNEFAVTYAGSGARLLSFTRNATTYTSIMANDTARNIGGQLDTQLMPSGYTGTGSAGGTFALNNITGEITYTPVSSTFTGVDIMSYQCVEELPYPYTVSPAGYGKIYVTVEGTAGSSIPAVGKPYLKLVVTQAGSPLVYIPRIYIPCVLTIEVYKDAAATIPYPLQDLGLLSITLLSSSNKSGSIFTYANQSFTITGGAGNVFTLTPSAVNYATNFPGIFIQFDSLNGDYTYTLLTSANYIIL